jgi:hypothetical protein
VRDFAQSKSKSINVKFSEGSYNFDEIWVTHDA